MDEIIERVKAEREDLNGKIAKLSAFMSSKQIEDLTPEHEVALKTQFSAMIMYSQALAYRLELFEQGK